MEGRINIYIERKIKEAEIEGGSDTAIRRANRTGKSHAELARSDARGGFTFTTASHLRQDETLTLEQKAKLLAQAYEIDAKRLTRIAEFWSSEPSMKEINQKDAGRSMKNAQNLTRAAKKARHQI